MDAITTPKTGERYEHKFWLEPDLRTPQQVKVTKRWKRLIYYRTVHVDKHGNEQLGSVYYTDVDNWQRYLGRKVV